MRVGILTVSTSRAAAGRPRSRAATSSRRFALGSLGGEVALREIVSDERAAIEERLRRWSDVERCDLILTTGGTGVAPRDVTPEATRAAIEREVPVIPEAMRAASREHTRHWMLSRGVAGNRGATLIVTFPGSPRSIAQAGEAIAGALPHALALLAGEAAPIMPEENPSHGVGTCASPRNPRRPPAAEEVPQGLEDPGDRCMHRSPDGRMRPPVVKSAEAVMSVVDEQLSVGLRWLGDGRRVVCALLVDAEGSSPFEPGAFMLIDAGGAIEGSITGGCVESDVVENALAILAGDEPPRLLRYGVSDELAATVGLMCGGSVQVLVHELRDGAREVCAEAFEAAAASLTAGIATVVDGPDAGAKLARGRRSRHRRLRRSRAARPQRRARPAGAQRPPHQRAAPLRGRRRRARRRAHGPPARVLGVPPTLVLVGAIDYSAAVAALAGQVGYRVVVIVRRARGDSARSDRFSRVATVHVGWPAEAIAERALGPRDAVIIFSHDPKFDEPAILAALRSEVGYIGALGSRRTAADRNRRLAEAGASAGRARARALAVRPRHRRRDAGGGRDLDHGRGDRGALGPRPGEPLVAAAGSIRTRPR